MSELSKHIFSQIKGGFKVPALCIFALTNFTSPWLNTVTFDTRMKQAEEFRSVSL